VKRCPKCNKEFKGRRVKCPDDGEQLVLIAEPAAPIESLVGATLDNKYRVEKVLGRGGMGTVYKATHTAIGQTVAIKVMHPHLAADRTAVKRFEREARAAARIRHPNAIFIYDFGETPAGLVYFVMEYVPGKTLSEIIFEQGPLPISRALPIMRQVCGAIHSAHSKGIIHRDLKPDNIIIDRETGQEIVKVLDFGIAKVIDDSNITHLTKTGIAIGTPDYMSPEQIEGLDLDPRSDIYSLGVILFRMLTGHLPFTGPTPVAVVVKHLNEPPPRPRQLNPAISPEVEEVMLRVLAKKREERPQSAMELYEQLERAAGPLAESGVEIAATKNEPLGAAPAINLESPRKTPETPITNSTLYQLEQSNTAQMKAEEVAQAATADQKPDEKAAFLRWDSGIKRFAAAAASLAIISALIYFIAFTDSGEGINYSGPPSPISQLAAQKAADLLSGGGMIFVTGGKFTMGYGGASDLDGPSHREEVDSFYIDEKEVTFGEFKEFVERTGYRSEGDWNRYYSAGKEQYPVVGVTWNDASAYARDQGKRLPSEKEWEYAARGNKEVDYVWGREWNSNFANTKEAGVGRAELVGSRAKDISWCGALDMTGNVQEWIADRYALYPNSDLQLKSEAANNRVVRGGCFNLDKTLSKTYIRFHAPPNKPDPCVGFRCAKDAGNSLSQPSRSEPARLIFLWMSEVLVRNR